MKILHLYYDIMNLYGDYGNVCAIKRILNKNSFECEVDRLTIGDNANFNDYNFIYVGAGTESNQKIVLEDFKKYKDQLEDYVYNVKIMLMTGNSFEMLGKTITDCNGKVYEGLQIDNFTTVEQNKKRVTGDCIFINEDCVDHPVVGFINKCSEIEGISFPLFHASKGISDNPGNCKEGLRINNLIGTHLAGPFLIKNPFFLQQLAGLMIEDPQLPELTLDDMSYEKASYNTTIHELAEKLGYEGYVGDY